MPNPKIHVCVGKSWLQPSANLWNQVRSSSCSSHRFFFFFLHLSFSLKLCCYVEAHTVLASTALLSKGKGKVYFKSSNPDLSLQILLTLAINAFIGADFKTRKSWLITLSNSVNNWCGSIFHERTFFLLDLAALHLQYSHDTDPANVKR